MAFQNSASGILIWRIIAGIGIGVELVTIDTYIAELVPKELRGRAFAFNQVVQFCAVPVVALAAWLLVPLRPLGLDGWRWVVLIGAAGALFVWVIRRGVPESPRWLIAHGKLEEAERVVAAMEARVAAEFGRPLPAADSRGASEEAKGTFADILRPPYLGRTLMLVVFHFFQTIGYYGFASWVPTLMIAAGITTTLEFALFLPDRAGGAARAAARDAHRGPHRAKMADRGQRDLHRRVSDCSSPSKRIRSG